MLGKKVKKPNNAFIIKFFYFTRTDSVDCEAFLINILQLKNTTKAKHNNKKPNKKRANHLQIQIKAYFFI